MSNLIPVERIENRIYLIRGQKVMLDRDIAELYGVKTKVLKQAVKRNIERFPDDFMFELSKEELYNWRSQIVTSNSDKMGLRHAPYAFTEQGIAMLSSILKSKKSIMVNIVIMRAFVKLNRILSSHIEVSKKLKEIEEKTIKNEKDIQVVFDTIKKLITPSDPPKRKFGFLADR